MMTWQINPYAFPLYIIAALLLLMLVYAWRHRANPTVRLFMLTIILACTLTIGYANELLAADLDTMRVWLTVEYFAHGVLAALLLFSLSYAGYDRWISRRLLVGLFLPAILMAVLVATNDLHGLVWRSTGVVDYNGLKFFDREYGPVFWLWFAYLTVLMVIASFFLLRRGLLSPGMFRWQATLIIIGALLPWFGSLLTVARLSPVPYLDLQPYGISLMVLPVGVSLLRFRLLDLIPAAHAKVIETIQDALIVCDHRLRIIEINPAACDLLALTAPASLGQVVADVLPMLPALTGTDTITAEITLDENRCFDVQAIPLASQQDDSGWLLVLRDVTTRKEAERRALELHIERERVRMLEEIMVALSHDFRTPITVISTANYLIGKLIDKACAGVTDQDMALVDGRVLEQIRVKSRSIDESTARLSHIFDDLLEVISTEQAPPFELKPADLNAVVRQHVRYYHSLSDAEVRECQLDLSPDLPPAHIELIYFKRALNSLLDNAHQYTQPGSTITVRTCHDPDTESLWVEVSDNGPGIAFEDQPHVFKHFYRADKARSIHTGGAGVGLSIARTIVERHGGTLTMHSAPGVGSTFRIVLPLHVPTAADVTAPDFAPAQMHTPLLTG